MPKFDPLTWRLTIDGLVEKPVPLTYEQLRALPRVDQVSTFHCVTGWTVSNVRWGGVRFRDLLAAAALTAEAKAITLTRPPRSRTPTRSRSSRPSSTTRCSPTR